MFKIIDEYYVKVSYDAEQFVVFDISYYRTTLLDIGDHIFTEINGLINTFTDKKRKELYKQYREIHDYLDIGSNVAMIENPIRELVGKIYDMIDFDSVKKWVRNNRHIEYPATVKDDYTVDDQTAKDRTYLRSEYFDLVVFAVWVRLMVPIWGMYIPIVEVESGAAKKEYTAFRITSLTEINTCHVMDRLAAYVEVVEGYSKLDNVNTVAITGALSSSETLSWVLQTTVVRRISIGQIEADRTKGHLVSAVWNYVSYLVKGYEQKFGDVIHPKKPPGNSEEEKPVIDRIRSAQKESIGEMVIYSVYLSKRNQVVEDIDPTVPIETIQQFITGSINHVEQFQQILAQWCLSPVMTPYALENIVTRRTMEDNIAYDVDGNILRVNVESFAKLVSNPMHDALYITRTLLWHWGFKELSLMMTARREPNHDLFDMDTNDRIQTSTLQTLMEKFPHSTSKKGVNDRQRNVPYVAAVTLAKAIGYSLWNVEYPVELKNEIEPILDAGGKLRVPTDLAEQLALLTIKIVDIKKQMKLNNEVTHATL